MRVIEMVRFSKEMLERMSRNGIRTEDWKDVELFGEYERLTSSGEKSTWVVGHLSEKYGRSERTIHRIVRKFRGDAKQ